MAPVDALGHDPRVPQGAVSLDPDDPALKAESERLFPDPEKDALIEEIKRLGKKIPAAEKSSAATTYGIGDTLEATDIAALHDLVGWMRTRAK